MSTTQDSQAGSMQRGVRLLVEYNRISPDDKSGMVDIGCEGAECWVYADAGSHVGMQGQTDGEDERVMKLGAAIARLVREHFSAVTPLQDSLIVKPKKQPNESSSATRRPGAENNQ